MAKAMARNKCFDGQLFLEHAKKALRIAMDTLPAEHPRLAPFRHTVGRYYLLTGGGMGM